MKQHPKSDLILKRTLIGSLFIHIFQDPVEYFYIIVIITIPIIDQICHQKYIILYVVIWTDGCWQLSHLDTSESDCSEWVEVNAGFSAMTPCCTAAASRCTFSFRRLMKCVLSRGGCQCGFVIAKCMSDSSVFPSSAC